MSNDTANKTYHHGDLKEALLLASRNILSEKGADALSLRAIAANVGVSHMAPYSHFKNKKELFQSIAASGFDELVERMISNSQSTTNPTELVLVYGATYVEFAIDHPQLYRLMLGQVENVGRRFQNEQSTKKQDSLGGNVSQHETPDLDVSFQRPFELLHQAFAKIHHDESLVKAQALGAWSMVHGMAALLIEGQFKIPESMSTKEFLAMATFQPPR